MCYLVSNALHADCLLAVTCRNASVSLLKNYCITKIYFSDNIEAVYKFANAHSVSWLSTYCLTLFENMIPKNFVGIFQ